jgi:squalene-hopene/tetraprenyl-beta-curcumene cyclase
MKLTAPLALLVCAAQILHAEEPIPRRTANLSLRNEVQLAIDKGLGWLEKNQNPNGSWSMDEHPALTALPLRVFMLEPSGKFQKERPAFIQKGYDFLLSCVQPDGGIYKKGLANYNTSLSLTALAAAGDAKFQQVIAEARKFVISQQAKGLPNPALDGGIGYGPSGTSRQHPDLSNTVIALEALHASRTSPAIELAHAGDLDWEAVRGFIQRTQNLPAFNKEPWASDDPENLGGFVYFPGHSMAGEVALANGKKALRSYGSMSYAGLLSYIYADLKKDDPRVQGVVDWLRRHFTLDENPGMGKEGQFYYYQVMAKALATYGVTEFELADGRKVDWQRELALKLIGLQNADGSWVNESGRWMEKDPVLVTSYALLALEAIYRGL